MTAETHDRLYTPRFFQALAAVWLFMTGVALQFHFGQYLGFLGHGVDTLGRVLSISTIGTLLIRFHLGRWIDRFGCRPVWLVGTLLMAATVWSIQFVTELWMIVALRTLSTMAIALVMTTVVVFAAQLAPPHRRAESIGTIGLAGLFGMTIGPAFGDWIFSGAADSILPYRIFFSVGACCSLAAGAVMMTIPLPSPSRSVSGEPNSPDEDTADPSTIRVVIKHWPGAIMLIGLVFSAVFCLHMSFLERLAEERGFKDIKVFFLCYGPMAMTLRLVLRRMPERFGRRRTVLAGSALMVGGLLCLIGIESQPHLILPGLLMGAGHAFIFPSMVDLAAGSLPADHRGTGTALIMGAGDLGMLIGFAALGELIDAFGFDVALLILASVVFATAAFYAASVRRRPGTRQAPRKMR